MSLKHLVVMNPRAGRRQGRDPRQVAEALRRRGLDAAFVLTERRGHARELVRERGPHADVVIVVGGDGTLHEVIQDLDLERHRLGIIPWGSGNDFAWSLGLPGDLEAALDRIDGGVKRRVDVGSYRLEHPVGVLEGRFHNQMGFGFEALVNEASHRVTRLSGAAVYLWAFGKTLPCCRTYPVVIDWDGGKYDGEVLLLAAGNGRRVGGCFRFFPDASLEDGKLNLLFTEPVGVLRAPFVLPHLVRGTYAGTRGIHGFPTAEIRIRSAAGIPAYVDGEFLVPDARTVHITTLPGALRVV